MDMKLNVYKSQVIGIQYEENLFTNNRNKIET